MYRSGYLWIYSTWVLLSFFNVQINSFIKFEKFSIIISPNIHSGSPIRHTLVCSWCSIDLWSSTHSSLSFFFCSSDYIILINLSDSSFCHSKVLLSPFSEFFNSCTLYKSRIYIWFFFSYFLFGKTLVLYFIFSIFDMVCLVLWTLLKKLIKNVCLGVPVMTQQKLIWPASMRTQNHSVS